MNLRDSVRGDTVSTFHTWEFTAAEELVTIHPAKQLTRYWLCLQKLWCEGMIWKLMWRGTNASSTFLISCLRMCVILPKLPFSDRGIYGL